ncbi:ABC transporter substrate-binding protein [Paenibacillus sp. TRM 82003]|nr:ABC transporter substrate-binding protein [Paenibacillus sp. TRM 82003]
MKLHRHYLRLHAQYGAAGEEALVTLEEIALALGCTHRNAVIVVRDMRERGWLAWEAQRGRGRRSRLRLLAPREEIAALSVARAMNRKDVLRSLDPIQADVGSAAVQDGLQGWLREYFGHHAELRDETVIDTLRLPVRQPLQTIDPLYMNLLAESFVSSHVFDGLVRRADGTGEPEPNLAFAWETDETRTVWTFYLRKEIPTHQGRMLAADDVVYTFDRLRRTSRRTLYSFVFKRIRSVQAVHRTAVRIELEAPDELFLPFLATSRAAIVPRPRNDEEAARWARKPFGTGPFRVAALNEDACVLEAFGPYFRGRAHLDRVEVVHVPSGGARIGAAGDPAEAAEAAEGPISPFHVVHSPSDGAKGGWSRIHTEASVRKLVTCNAKRPGPLADAETRAQVLACLRGDVSARPAEPRTATDGGSPLRLATIAPYAADAERCAAALRAAGRACVVSVASPEQFKGPIRLESDLILFSLLRDQDEALRRFDLYLTIAEHIDARTEAAVRRELDAARCDPDAAARDRLLDAAEALLTASSQLLILSERPIETAYLPSVRGVRFNAQGWVDLRSVWFPPRLDG